MSDLESAFSIFERWNMYICCVISTSKTDLFMEFWQIVLHKYFNTLNTSFPFCFFLLNFSQTQDLAVASSARKGQGQGMLTHFFAQLFHFIWKIASSWCFGVTTPNEIQEWGVTWIWSAAEWYQNNAMCLKNLYSAFWILEQIDCGWIWCVQEILLSPVTDWRLVFLASILRYLVGTCIASWELSCTKLLKNTAVCA